MLNILILLAVGYAEGYDNDFTGVCANRGILQLQYSLMRLLCLYIILLLACGVATAQQQNQVWAMGFGTGLSFHSNPPITIATQMQSVESVGSVCDRHTGKLLFYTDGVDLYNANHSITPNGKDIGIDTTHSTAQGVLFVPFVNDTNRYYLFTMAGHRYNGTLRYSVVDKRLNGGLGDVVAGQKSIYVADSFTEAMTVVEQPGCNRLWLLTFKKESLDYYAFEITKDGLDTLPTISTVDYNVTATNIAVIKVSPDRKKLITTAIGAPQGDGAFSYLALHDFDWYTGRISNGKLIETFGVSGMYGCEFSPNSKRVYAAHIIAREVYQYNIDLPDAHTIKSSRRVLQSNLETIGGLQLGPDSNIYIGKFKGIAIDRITNCDALYPNCVYTQNAINVSSGEMGLTLPQPVVYAEGTGDAGHTATSRDTTVCLQQPMLLRATTSNGGHLWQNGSGGDTYEASQTGIYWVRTNSKCQRNTDTIKVKVEPLALSVIGDTVICMGDSITLRSNALPTGTTYSWSTGSTVPTTKVWNEGIYKLKVSYLGCVDSGYARIAHHPSMALDLGKDQQLCAGDKLTLPLSATAEGANQYLWQDGSTATSYEATQAGVYHLSITNQCTTITDTIVLTARQCHFFFPTAFSPNYDGRNDQARLVGDVSTITNYDLRIVNRWGELVYQTNNVAQGWDGNYKGKPAEVGAYYYLIKYTYQGSEEQLKGMVLLIR